MVEDIDYYIVFTDAGRWNFWDVFTSPGWRHCMAVRWDGYNWLAIDPIGSMLHVDVLDYTEKDDVPRLLASQGHKVVYIRKQQNDKFIMRGMMTCVTITKHLLGIRAWWVMTPKQLAKHLVRKHNGIFKT